MTPTPKTVAAVLEAGAGFIEARDVPYPRLACELLMSRLLRCQRLELYVKYDMVLSEKHLQAMRRGVKRVADGEPVQYVLGQTEFMGHVFKVDKRALIPRPETEGLVEHILKCEDIWKSETPAILDVGTGTGCIVVSLALAKPAGHYMGLDVSPDAIALAEENAKALGVKDPIGFGAKDMSDAVEPEMIDVLVTNPPYVPTAEYENLPVHIRDHEPRMALDGGPAGLSVIEPLIQDATIVLKPGGRLFMEIGDTQADAVTAILSEAGFQDVSVTKDLADKDRIVSAVWGK